MKKIIIIGSPGAGKSTFARKLRDKTGLPLYYLDMLWHLPDRTTVTREEFDAKLAAIMAADEWILDGNFGRTMETRMQHCDTIFLLDYPMEVCLAGIKARVGTVREEMPWVEEELNKDFAQWVTEFPKVRLPEIYSLLEKYQEGREVHILRSREETDAYLQSLETAGGTQ
ncbi:MAG: adenylate kinase [Lachnospiraceae bacterium]|nr:adenylate kinase [Lachnospiraceae bacterium]